MDARHWSRFAPYPVALGVAGTVVGMVLSPAVLSIGVIVTVAAALLLYPGSLPGFVRRGWPRGTLFWGLTGLYLLLLAGSWQTYDWPYYLERLRIKLPLLMLPLAWAADPFSPLDAATQRRWARFARLALLGFVAAVLAGVLMNYALHFSEINVRIGQGQAVPVPRGNHVRFSLLVAICAVIGADGWLRDRSRGCLLLGLFLLAGLHLLAVRTGLVTAYVGVVVVAGGHALAMRRYRLLLGAAVAVAALPVAAYLLLPSFRTKMQYTRFEVMHRGVGGTSDGYSDAGRFTSIRLGMDVWRERPWVGVGPGNLLQAMDARYAEVLPEVQGKRPHNQFVTALAGSGLLGGVVTLACFGLIGYADGRWRDPRYAAVFAMLLLSCLVESTLENSVGVTLFSFFLLALAYPPYRKPG